jgi:hypothetical protein
VNTKLLVDGIVRQTTILIAQVSTAAGIRAPLAHIADQVFLDLAREIEAQGVGRKVIADMFGIALRSYQKKVRRLTESESSRSRTLWQAVLETLSSGSVTRARLLERFQYDGEREVLAVLNDLITSGLIYCTGRGSGALYGLTTAADRQALSNDDGHALYHIAWMKVFQGEATTRQALSSSLGVPLAQIDAALVALRSDGRLEEGEDGTLRASNLVVPVGAALGWETAILDHFAAMARAIASKIQLGRTQSSEADQVGGATLTFTIGPNHPFENDVLGLLSDVRERVNELWSKVSEHNREHAPNPEDRVRVTFYFGQAVQRGATAHDGEDARTGTDDDI